MKDDFLALVYAAIGGFVDKLVGNFDFRKAANEFAQERVVIAGRVVEMRPAAREFEQPLENSIVNRIPAPG